MRLIWTGIVVGALAGSTASGAAQGSWTPQASPSPPPAPPVYGPPAPPSPPPPLRQGKERPAAPLRSPSSWMTTDDYPAESLRANEQGTTAFRATVGPDGIATDCAITASSGFAGLDDTACRLVKERGQFSPALDKKGKPITGTWASRFKWVLPEPKIMPAPQPNVDVMTFIVEPDGSATECARNGSGSGFGRDQGPCGYGQVFEPYKDLAGNPVRRKVSLTLSVVVTDPAAPPPVAAPAVPAPRPKRRKP